MVRGDGDSCDGSDHHSTHPLQPVEISQVAQDMPKLRSPAGTCDVTPLSDSCMFLFCCCCDTGAVCNDERRTYSGTRQLTSTRRLPKA